MCLHPTIGRKTNMNILKLTAALFYGAALFLVAAAVYDLSAPGALAALILALATGMIAVMFHGMSDAPWA